MMNFTRMALGTLVMALVAGTARGQEKSAPVANDSKPADAKASGGLEEAKLIHMVPPVYPKEAKDAGIGGTVVVKGVIAKDGSVQQVEYVSGPEELKQAAIEAVKQWQYKPETLGGKPIEVGTTVSLVFTPKKSDEGGTGTPGDSNGSAASQADSFDALNGKGPQPAPPPHTNPTRIRVGGAVQAAQLVHFVLPDYPLYAKDAHITGTVRLHAIIAKDGSMLNVEYVSGPDLFKKAAIDAVKKWRYRPTMLMGQPVEVDTTIDVVFALG